jgi:hypothetical protein
VSYLILTQIYYNDKCSVIRVDILSAKECIGSKYFTSRWYLCIFYCVVGQTRNYVCYERHNTELQIEIGKNRKMFSMDVRGGREWVWATGKKFSGPLATADQLNIFTR